MGKSNIVAIAAPVSPLAAHRQEHDHVESLIAVAERELADMRQQGERLHDLSSAITAIRQGDAEEFAAWVIGGSKGPEPKGRLADINRLEAKGAEERYRLDMLRGVIVDREAKLAALYRQREALQAQQPGVFVDALVEHSDGIASRYVAAARALQAVLTEMAGIGKAITHFSGGKVEIGPFGHGHISIPAFRNVKSRAITTP